MKRPGKRKEKFKGIVARVVQFQDFSYLVWFFFFWF